MHVQQVPISFLKQGSFAIAAGFDNKTFSVFVGHTLPRASTTPTGSRSAVVNPGTYKFDFFDD